MRAAVRGAAAALAVVAIAAGCGGSSPTAQRRDAVNAYFKQVDRAQAELVKNATAIDRALQGFDPARTTPQELSALVSAQRTIRRALVRVRAVAPPADAARVHAELVRLLDLQASLAGDLVWSARFIPRFAATVQPLAAAAATLGRDLAAVKAPPAASGGDAVFSAAGCGGCHTLAAAGANGTAGPNLDRLRPSSAVVAAQVARGGGAMPSFSGTLSAAQIAAVAAYVSSVAGRPGAAPKPSPAAPTASAQPDVFQQYAAAFARYRTAIRPTVAALDELQAPPELRPALLAERHAVHRSAALCASIERALRKRDVAGANAAIRALFGVAAGVNGAETRRSQAAAAQAYDARIAAVGRLAARVSAERQRLVQAIG